MNAIEVLRASIEDAHTTFIGTTWDMTYVVKNQRALADLEALVQAAVPAIGYRHDANCCCFDVATEDECNCGQDVLAAAVTRCKGDTT